MLFNTQTVLFISYHSVEIPVLELGNLQFEVIKTILSFSSPLLCLGLFLTHPSSGLNHHPGGSCATFPHSFRGDSFLSRFLLSCPDVPSFPLVFTRMCLPFALLILRMD